MKENLINMAAKSLGGNINRPLLDCHIYAVSCDGRFLSNASGEEEETPFTDRAYKLKVNCFPINLNETCSSSLSTQANWQRSE